MGVGYQMRISYYFLPVILNPVIALIANMVGVIARKKVSYLAISLSIVLVYSYLPVLWDVRNNYYRIYFNPDEGLNPYTQILNFLVTYIGLNFIPSVATIAIIPAIFFSITLSPMIEGARITSGVKFYSMVFLFLFLFEFRNLFDLQKTYISVTFFIIGLFYRSQFYCWVMMCISIIIHPMMILLPISYAVALIFPIPKSYLVIIAIIGGVVGLFLGSVILELVANIASSFIPRAAFYAAVEDSRFSSSNIALLVRYMRIFSLIIFIGVFLKYTSQGYEKNKRTESTVVILLSACAILISFNEIALERYYMAVSLVASYLAIKFSMNSKLILMIVFAVGLNTITHGIYTINVIFSPKYDIYANDTIKTSMALKLLFFPSPILAAHELVGYSDDNLASALR